VPTKGSDHCHGDTVTKIKDSWCWNSWLMSGQSDTYHIDCSVPLNRSVLFTGVWTFTWPWWLDSAIGLVYVSVCVSQQYQTKWTLPTPWTTKNSPLILSVILTKSTNLNAIFTARSNRENCLKIRWLLTNLQTKLSWLLSMAHGVDSWHAVSLDTI